ncbi:P-loop containing nucleoside triphosphate hydrolase protein [Marasmius fiardii PR-910]|nr:P-loop containing nucleoside triphosphate hydrolase protein [Marasmius fiardii PR-910]
MPSMSSNTASMNSTTPRTTSPNYAALAQDATVEPSVGLSNAKLSESRRKLLETVNRLLNTGVQLDVNIPQIAVIGNQSAGKSSLIEAISGITLPRGSGTCIRCPIESRLKNSKGPWTCVVSIRTLLGQAKNEVFGKPIYDKHEVEERICRAQIAILNPNLDRTKILEGERPEFGVNPGSVPFSTNCIAIEISGPDVADLSFCDLPGLIRSTRDGTSRDIELVDPQYLIHCPHLADHMNQGALHLAKKFDPTGERTVGVLTKPDRIDRGDEHSWVSFIRGEEQPLRNPWFCVKQPSTSELQSGLTWDEARKLEAAFFSTTTPWCDLDPMYRKYLQTSNLVDRLSIILSDLIAQRLPEIRKELETLILNTRSALRDLPRPPSSDPLNEISGMLFAFKMDVNRGVQEEDSEYCSQHEEEGDVVGEVGDNEDRETDGIYIEEVQQRTNNVEESFIKEITQHWTDPAQTYCEEVYETSLDQIDVVIKKHFKDFGQGHLERQIRNMFARNTNRLAIDWIGYDLRDKLLEFYKKLRQEDKHPDLMKATRKQPSPFSFGCSDPLLPIDEMEPALKIMAEARAYFQVAYKRFADNVPLVVDYELVQGLERNLLEVLLQKLKIHSASGAQICKEFAQENSVIANRREELTTRLERLKSASRELMKM